MNRYLAFSQPMILSQKHPANVYVNLTQLRPKYYYITNYISKVFLHNFQDQPLHQVIQEALNTHFQGLAFRERNAGRAIDEHMRDQGFNNQIGTNPNTGFVFGGNEWNCGTWMDKMGSSVKAGNQGVPSTPRDGSAVEIVGLQYASLRLLQKLAESRLIPFDSVQRKSKSGAETVWTFKKWADLIQSNFETEFYVTSEMGSLVNKVGIYKDSVGASQPWSDFQLRCNFPITMVAVSV